MRVLVTGSTGFIGTHLVAALVARGWHVRCLVRATSNRMPLAAQPVEYVVGTLQDRQALQQAVQGMELIVHLAGVTKVYHAAEYDRINYGGTQQLLEACAESCPTLRKFLYISSIAAAGPSPTGVPLKESDAPQPVGPYGRSKLRAEAAVLACQTHLPVMVLRPSAIYGPRDSDFLRLFRAVKHGVLPCIGRQELHVDLCFVMDLVRGMIAAAESSQGLGEVFFLGGACHTWRGLGQAIARLLHTQPRDIALPRQAVLMAASLADGWAYLRRRPGLLSRTNVLERLQPYWVCDSTKALHTFGYVPQIPLAQGLAETLRWYQDAGWL
ncbi:MAG TPA: NAD-dependent epimerase/dehydratase family protein [Candidatus Tectomicrobia bacterium]